MRKIHPSISLICTFVIFIFSACGPAPVNNPSAEAAAWVGDWTVWVIKSENAEPGELSLTADGHLLSGEIAIGETSSAAFTAEVGMDGLFALGSYVSDEELSDTISMMLSDDGNQFSGYLHGIAAVCGAREGFEKPDPCLSAFEPGWEGGWTVWMGPMETRGEMFFDPVDGSAGPLNYAIDLAVSEDGKMLSGNFYVVGTTGTLEAVMLENGVQFTGTMDKIFPFCGVRPGGPKPEPCLRTE